MVLTLSNRLLFAAIFISGASALIYQLIWVRLLGLVFGVSSFAVATVVAVFLLGLGLGSYFFGRWSERTRDPLRIYLYVELGIAATPPTWVPVSARSITSTPSAHALAHC
jgi:spermidine synthase